MRRSVAFVIGYLTLSVLAIHLAHADDFDSALAEYKRAYASARDSGSGSVDEDRIQEIVNQVFNPALSPKQATKLMKRADERLMDDPQALWALSTALEEQWENSRLPLYQEQNDLDRTKIEMAQVLLGLVQIAKGNELSAPKTLMSPKALKAAFTLWAISRGAVEVFSPTKDFMPAPVTVMGLAAPLALKDDERRLTSNLWRELGTDASSVEVGTLVSAMSLAVAPETLGTSLILGGVAGWAISKATHNANRANDERSATSDLIDSIQTFEKAFAEKSLDFPKATRDLILAANRYESYHYLPVLQILASAENRSDPAADHSRELSHFFSSREPVADGAVGRYLLRQLIDQKAQDLNAKQIDSLLSHLSSKVSGLDSGIKFNLIQAKKDFSACSSCSGLSFSDFIKRETETDDQLATSALNRQARMGDFGGDPFRVLYEVSALIRSTHWKPIQRHAAQLMSRVRTYYFMFHALASGSVLEHPARSEK